MNLMLHLPAELIKNKNKNYMAHKNIIEKIFFTYKKREIYKL